MKCLQENNRDCNVIEYFESDNSSISEYELSVFGCEHIVVDFFPVVLFEVHHQHYYPYTSHHPLHVN